jgi:hypothetical protein
VIVIFGTESGEHREDDYEPSDYHLAVRIRRRTRWRSVVMGWNRLSDRPGVCDECGYYRCHMGRQVHPRIHVIDALLQVKFSHATAQRRYESRKEESGALRFLCAFAPLRENGFKNAPRGGSV